MLFVSQWDTAGEEKFDSLTNFYCRGAAAALICYDITNFESFASLQRWVDKIVNEADKNCVIVLVGNKLDLAEADPSRRKVDVAEAKRYASSIGAQLIEVSAKSGTNVNKAFEEAVRLCFEKNTSQAQQRQQSTVSLSSESESSSGCCK